MARTFAAVDVTSSVSPWHMLVTTPAVVAVISSAIAGVMAGLVAGQLSMALEVAVVVGIGVFLVAVVGLIAYGRREADRYIDAGDGEPRHRHPPGPPQRRLARRVQAVSAARFMPWASRFM